MLINVLLKNDFFVPAISVNDLLNDDNLIPSMLIMFFVIMVFAIPAGIAMSKKANRDIYGDDDDPVIVERGAKIIARRVSPHPMNQAVMINMVVFELPNGNRVELVVKDSNMYGVMVEGDCGTLKYQGKKIITFERERSNET